VPAVPGVYGWWFDELPYDLDASGCRIVDDMWLLYIGIAPKAPPMNGRVPSTQNLRTRVRYHYRGNAEGSTLRLSLGCLLAERLGIELRSVGSGTRMTFSSGEPHLSNWMAEHARVSWSVVAHPWTAETQLLNMLDLPLNIDQNRNDPFCAKLAEIRASAKNRARKLEVIPAV